MRLLFKTEMNCRADWYITYFVLGLDIPYYLAPTIWVNISVDIIKERWPIITDYIMDFLVFTGWKKLETIIINPMCEYDNVWENEKSRIYIQKWKISLSEKDTSINQQRTSFGVYTPNNELWKEIGPKYIIDVNIEDLFYYTYYKTEYDWIQSIYDEINKLNY